MTASFESPEFRDLESNYRLLLPEDKHARILDLGCGHGRITRYLISLGYGNVTAIDPDASLVELVRNFCPSAEHTTDTGSYLKSMANTFDLIIAKDVIYYFPRSDVAELMKYLKSALRPGGALILEVFNGATQTGPFVAYKDLGIEWIPTEPGLRRLLAESGFTDTKLFPIKTKIESPKKAIYFFVNKLWQFFLRSAHFIERGIDSENPTIWTKKIIGYAR